MRLINELFTAWRILVPGDRGAGARSPNTSKPAPDHRVYPYLLRNRTIDRPNHVRAADITYLPIGPGTGALMAAGINISMDGRRRKMDNVFIERVRRSLKHEDIYLKRYADGPAGSPSTTSNILPGARLPSIDGRLARGGNRAAYCRLNAAHSCRERYFSVKRATNANARKRELI